MHIEIATKQDIEALKNELLQALATFTSRGNEQQEKQWLRSKEVRHMLGISNGTLQNLRIKGLLKPSKIEGVFYYRLSEIKALLNADAQQ